MGKGDHTRPRQVSREEFYRSYERIFKGDIQGGDGTMTTLSEACPCCEEPLLGTHAPMPGIQHGEDILCPFCSSQLRVEVAGAPGQRVFTFTNWHECEERG